MFSIAAEIRLLAVQRSNVMKEWSFGSWVIRYNCGFVSWRRKWEQTYPIGWDANVFLEELEAR
jgi:hypothetical protein